MLDVHLYTFFQPAHEIWIHIACALSFSIKMHVQLSSVEEAMLFDESLLLRPLFGNESNEGSIESELMHRHN